MINYTDLLANYVMDNFWRQQRQEDLHGMLNTSDRRLCMFAHAYILEINS